MNIIDMELRKQLEETFKVPEVPPVPYVRYPADNFSFEEPGKKVSKQPTFNKYLSTKVPAQEFEKMVEEVFDKVRYLVVEKAKEYASPGDRFKNFTDSVHDLHQTPEEVLLGYLQKHKDSMWSMVLDLRKEKTYPLKQWDSKLLDMIVYTIILRGIITVRDKEQGL